MARFLFALNLPGTLYLMANVVKSMKVAFAIGLIFGFHHLAALPASKYPRYFVSKYRVIYTFGLMAVIFIPLALRIFYTEDKRWDNVALKFSMMYWNFINPLISCAIVANKIARRHFIRDQFNAFVGSIQNVCEFAGEYSVSIVGYLVTTVIICMGTVLFDFANWCLYWMGDYFAAMYMVITIGYFGVNVLILAESMNVVMQTLQMGMEKAFPRQKKYFGWSDIEEDTSKDLKNYAFQSPEELVHRCCVLYHEVFSAFLKLNRTNGFSLFAVTAHLAITTLVSIYSAFAYIPCMTLDELSWIPSLFGWVFFALASLLLLIYPCAKATNCSAEVLYVANGYLANSTNRRVTTELSRLVCVLKNERVIFMPLGLFCINYNLILTIIGSAVSYLIILGQVQQSSANDCRNVE